MSEYSQSRSFNLGIAMDTSIEAAMIYDDLAYAQKVFGDGYFFRSDEQMVKRFPVMSKSSIRRHVKKLVETGYISTKVKKVSGVPTLNYQIEHSLMVNLNKSKEMVKMTIPISIETKEETTSKVAVGKELLVLVNNVLGREFRVLPERGVKKTLDSFSLVEIELALTALAQDDWHRGKLRELKLDYFIRATTIDKFLAIAKKKNIKPQDAKTQDQKVAEFEAEQEKIRKANENRDWGF